MPTHGVVPYEISMWERNNPDNLWDLTDLRAGDDDLPTGSLTDAIEEMLSNYKEDVVNDTDREKFMYIMDYNRSDNVVEGIVAAGDHGYEAEILNIETGEATYNKSENESEVLPYYFLFWIPRSLSGEPWNGGSTALIVFQQISGGSVKTDFSKLFNREIMRDAPDTVHSFKPAARQRVLRELIESQRVRKAHIELKEVPEATDTSVHYVEGLNTQSVDTQTIILEPEHSGSLNPLQDVARELENTDSTFATITSDDVSDLSVEVTNAEGRDEKFSLFDDELKMKRKLSPNSSDMENGLPKTSYICTECCNETNGLYPQKLVQTLNHTTALSR